MLLSNGGGSSRRKLGLTDLDQSGGGGKTPKTTPTGSSRRLLNNSQQPSTPKSSGSKTPAKNSSAKELKSSLKKSSSLKAGKKAANRLSTSSLKNASSKPGPKKQKKLLKERRQQQRQEEEDENDENDEYRYRDDDDLVNMDEMMMSATAVSSSENELEAPMVHMSREEYERNDQMLETRLDELKRRLDALKNVDLTAAATRSTCKYEDSFLNEFKAELERLEHEASSNMTSIKFWFDKERNEIEEQFKNEYKRSIHEYQERRKELKDMLRNDNEDARRQIEIERMTLDINTDVIEVKPAPTRNLRRRCVMASNTTATTAANSLFSSQVYIESLEEPASVSTAVSSATPVSVHSSSTAASGVVGPNVHQSPLLSSTLSAVVESISASAVSVSSVTGASSNALLYIQQQVSNGPLNGGGLNYDRKQRKVGSSSLAITISEDEINEDHKCLLKSLRQPHSASPKVHNTTLATASSD